MRAENARIALYLGLNSKVPRDLFMHAINIIKYRIDSDIIPHARFDIERVYYDITNEHKWL